MLTRPWTLLVVLLFIGLLVWSQRGARENEVTRTALIMGTLVEIKGVGPERGQLEEAISAAFAAMRDQEERFSPERETSQLSAINRAQDGVEVDDQVLELLRLGEQVTRESGGAFSMGLGGLKRLWNLDSPEPQVPTQAQIAAVLPATAGDQIVISAQRVTRLSDRVQLDLGGIAKGYAIDRALEVLRAAGLRSASVNAGGDIGLLGGHGERAWKIGIQHPRKAGEMLVSLELKGRAIVSSGDYERFFIQDGERYHHIFDPRTGRPARDCQSVSVLAGSAAEADALATASFVLGPQRGLELLESRAAVEGLIVAADGTVSFTSGLREQLQWN